jgi:O-acetyl-ADP-ribose deacetylase
VIAFTLPSLIVEFVDGDICAQDTDAIVNAANSELWMGGGVAGAIKSHGGAVIEREAMALGPIREGQCVVTAAGSLRTRWVIHAAVMGSDLRTSEALIARATQNVLVAAEENRFASIAIPALGTGVGHFPMSACASVMIGVVRSHAAVELRLARFVLFGQRAYVAFARVAVELLGTPASGPPDCPISG